MSPQDVSHFGGFILCGRCLSSGYYDVVMSKETKKESWLDALHRGAQADRGAWAASRRDGATFSAPIEPKRVVSSKTSSASPLESEEQWYYYLSNEGARKLPHYQYHGTDLSLLYKYVLSPFAAKCVDYLTPTWVAPNAITAFGLCWMVLSYTVIWYYCPGLYEANTDISKVVNYHVPPAIFLLNGCAMLIYQTLDNMDGKQARKVGASSPLGLLFDHGCDAMNLILGSANWIAAMALIPGNMSDVLSSSSSSVGGENFQSKSLLSHFLGGDANLALILILAPMIAFFITTWEQYYTGSLTLPPFNGPSEGLVMGASLSIVSYFYGPMFWQTTSLTDGMIDNFGIVSFLNHRVRNMDLIVFAAIVSLVQEVGLKLISVTRKYGLSTLRLTIPHVLLVTSTIVMVRYDTTIFLRNPRTMCHLISGLFTEHTTQLMMNHMVDEKYVWSERWCVFPQVFLAVWIMTGVSSNETLDSILFLYTTLLWVYLAFKISVQVSEICDALGIYCFDIVTVHPNKQKIVGSEPTKKIN